jgi:hypothetical protein
LSHKPKHRGADPEDARLFSTAAIPILRTATGDLCWLLSRGYSLTASVELVGNHYELIRRQRVAIARCACSDEALARRQAKAASPGQLAGREVWLDGLNVSTAVEAALSGGVVLLGRDGCGRDMAGVYARYRPVEETIPALVMVGEFLAAQGVRRAHWHLDKPVSNSGRLKKILLETAAAHGWDWPVDLVYSPDKILAETGEIIATGDSVILDRCQAWFNLAREVITARVPGAWLVDLAPGPSAQS